MDRTVVITGAGRGLGLELVRQAKKLGCTVFAGSRSLRPALLAEAGENCFVYACDVAEAASVEAFAEEVRARTEHVDILLNNAGVWLDNRRLRLEDPEFDFDLVTQQYAVNAVGVLRMVRAFLPLLTAATEAVVFNISSEADSITAAQRKCEYGYCMSKAAQNMATKLMANAYPALRFYAVHPGWMRTDQGFAGATGPAKPQQEPSDTAASLFEMARERPEGMYYDIDGRQMPW